MSCSSYLLIYLIPKAKEGVEAKPLFFQSFSGSSDVYQAFQDYAPIPYMGIGGNTYTDLTPAKVKSVISGLENDIKEFEQGLANYVEAFNKMNTPSIDVANDFTSEYESRKQYIDQLKATTSTVKEILSWVEDLEYSDFEKAVAHTG